MDSEKEEEEEEEVEGEKKKLEIFLIYFIELALCVLLHILLFILWVLSNDLDP